MNSTWFVDFNAEKAFFTMCQRHPARTFFVRSDAISTSLNIDWLRNITYYAPIGYIKWRGDRPGA
ncbi:MAG: hypothetical protein ABSF91_12365 [Bacteroidota bacterium]|jgi:hypothetical protein